MKIQFFHHMTPCRLVNADGQFDSDCCITKVDGGVGLAVSPETSVNIFPSSRRHIPEYRAADESLPDQEGNKLQRPNS